jgi:hydrogenase maturation protease
MNDIAIIGVGSPFGADRLGWQVLEVLEQDATLQARGVRWHRLDRPGTGLLAYMRDARHVIVVDAIQGGFAAGAIVCLQGNQIFSGVLPTSSHGIGLADTLALAQQLGDMPDTMVVIGMEIGSAGTWQATQTDIVALAEAVKRALDSLP